jgi:short-subunit dehydrogenase
VRTVSGSTAIVTGSTGGLGRAIADELTAAGANLVLADLEEATLEDQRRLLTGRGGRCAIVPGDLSWPEHRARLVERATAAFGSIDILINNAGLGHWARFQDQSLDEIAYVIEVNLVASLDLARLVLPAMVQRGGGHIVMVSSMVGKRGIPYEAVYSASKAGMIQWTHAVRLELAGSGVGVSVVCPGYVSEAGMFARWKRPAPRGAGAIAPERVARAVVRAIQDDRQEVLVWPIPARPLLVLDAISPRIGNWLIRAMGIERMNRDLATLDTARRAATTDGGRGSAPRQQKTTKRSHDVLSR